MDPLTGLQTEAVCTIHHTILDQISEPIADTPATMRTTQTAKTTIGTTIETGYQQNVLYNQRNNGFQTGMKIIKIGTGSTTEENQQNTNTTETNAEHR